MSFWIFKKKKKITPVKQMNPKQWWIDDVSQRVCAPIDHPEVGLDKLKWPDCDHFHIAIDKEVYDKLQKENQELKRKLDLAIEALEFYGDSSNYESHDISRADGLPCYDILCFDFDRNVRGKHLAGKRARKALKEIKGEQ